MKLIILLLLFLVIGTIGYGQQESLRGMWYLGTYYGMGVSMTFLLIIEKFFPSE